MRRDFLVPSITLKHTSKIIILKPGFEFVFAELAIITLNDTSLLFIILA